MEPLMFAQLVVQYGLPFATWLGKKLSAGGKLTLADFDEAEKLAVSGQSFEDAAKAKALAAAGGVTP